MRSHALQCVGRTGITLAVLAAFGGTHPVAAQITYSVFPAVSQAPNSGVVQPTDQRSLSHVTLTISDSTVQYVVSQLVQQAHLHVTYEGSPMLVKRVTVHVVDANIMDALATVLRGTGLQAKLAPDGETVMIRTQSGPATVGHAHLAAGIIAGRVTDSASGQGLGGASVRVAGTKRSTITSDSGHFTLQNVPPGDQVLTVRLFGYRPVDREVTVMDSGNVAVKIVMVPVPTVLSGVVTTAVGNVDRYKVGNDITVLNADSIMRVAPVPNLTDMLETRVPGLIIQHTTGIPGAPSRLRLRGTSSIYLSNDPILIVNGVRMYADQSGSTSPTGAHIAGGAVASQPPPTQAARRRRSRGHRRWTR